VSTTSLPNLHDELLRRIADISAMCEQIERAVQSLIEPHDELSDTVASGRALEAAVLALKRQLLQYYLECRIGEAARAVEAINN
jgi:hypothetical protein